jgi:hypothetical protein
MVAARPVNWWQQDVVYEIDVSLDTDRHSLTGHQQLAYTNNSPDTLAFVWFHAYPNAYRDKNSVFARGMAEAGMPEFHLAGSDARGWMEIRSIKVGDRELGWSYKPDDDTEIKADLPDPLPPGGSVVFEIDFYVKIPGHFGGFQRMLQKDGHYEISQWYPKVVVYDASGWHPDGYRLIGEFYGEFGTYDVRITVPANMTVPATGELVSPEEEIARLDSLAGLGARMDSLRDAGRSKEVKRILKRIEKAKLAGSTKTLHFHADSVHDFAWAADKDFVLKRGSYKDVSINVYTRPRFEKKGREAVGYTHDALESYSRHYGEYRHPQMTVVESPFGGGMEYPMLTMSGFEGTKGTRLLELVIMHETGHNWFQGMLGSDEMAEAYLDEGINSFAESRYLDDKYGREGNLTDWPWYLSYLPDLDDHYYHSFMYYALAVTGSDERLLMDARDYNSFISYFAMVYGKGARVTDMLRFYLGEETFDRVMQTYFEEYCFKHPTAEDLQEVAERVSGEDLDWFFEQWLHTTKKCDLTVRGFETRRSDLGRQVWVDVAQEGECRMPADVKLVTRSGREYTERWDGGGRRGTVIFDVDDRPGHVWIDPDDLVLEVNNWNNRKPRKYTFHFIADKPSFDAYQVFYGPSLWYDDDVDGLRPGLWFNGGQFRSLGPFFGRYEWYAGVSYGVDSQKWNYNFSMSHPVPELGRFTRARIWVKDLEGRIDGNAGLDFRFSRYAAQKPETRLQVRAFMQSVYDLGYLEPGNWERGQVVGGTLRLGYSNNSLRFPAEYRLDVKGAHDAFQSDFNFLRAWSTINYDLRWNKSVKAKLRLFGGVLDGTPPVQDRFYLSGGLVPEGPLAFVADGRGEYAPQNRYYVPGDANLRGYFGRSTADKVAASLGVTIPVPRTPVRFFYDIGNVWPELDRVTWQELKQDAGFALDFGFVSFHWPLWINYPAAGEKQFEYRWLISTHMNMRLM